MKVLIDNGHGEDTKGKRSPDGLLEEWRWTRLVAVLLAEKLAERGIEAVKLVTEDNDIPLRERVRRANAYGRDNLLVSLHVNASSSDGLWHNASGFSAFVAPRASYRSRLFAEIVEKKAMEMGLKGNRARKEYSIGNFAMVRDTLCPAVLTENLFMDNRRDCEFLLSEEGIRRIVSLHLSAIIQYTENKYMK